MSAAPVHPACNNPKGTKRRLKALLAPVARAGPGDLPAAGRLGGAAVHRQVVQAQAEQAVVGGQHGQAQLLGHAGGDPFVAAAAQGGRRAGAIGDAAIPAAEHQHLDELVEHDAVGDARAVAAEGVGDPTSGE